MNLKSEVAITSLKQALKAYFSTYQATKYNGEFFHALAPDFDIENFAPYAMDYARAYTEQ